MQRLNSSRLESLTFLDNIFSLLGWHSHFGAVSSYEKLAKISVTFPHFPSTSGSEATPLNAINYVAERKSGLADVAGRTHNTQNCNHFLFIFDVVSQPSIAGKVLCSPNRREKKRWNWIHYIFLLFFTFHSLRPEKRKLTFSSDDDFCVFAIFSRASEFIDSPAATVEACRVHLTQHKKTLIFQQFRASMTFTVIATVVLTRVKWFFYMLCVRHFFLAMRWWDSLQCVNLVKVMQMLRKLENCKLLVRSSKYHRVCVGVKERGWAVNGSKIE